MKKKSGGKRKGAGRKPVETGTVSTTQCSGFSRVKTKRGWKRLDRVTVEKNIGRKLSGKEHVWHRDGDKCNNDIDNLHVCLDEEYYWLKHHYSK